MSFWTRLKSFFGFSDADIISESYTHRDSSEWTVEEKQEFDQNVYQDIFYEIPSVPYLSQDDLNRAEDLFRAGWLTWGVYSEDELNAIRDQFYDAVGLREQDFDWDSFRVDYDLING